MRRPLIFIVSPDEIFEHPPELPVDPMSIKPGPLVGWWAYSCDFHGPHHVIAVKDPVIEVSKYRDEWNGIYIRMPSNSHTVGSDYWYVDPLIKPEYDRRCWFQSGSTLRFVKDNEKNSPAT